MNPIVVIGFSWQDFTFHLSSCSRYGCCFSARLFLLNSFFYQNAMSSITAGGFDWKGQSFYQAQSRIAALVLSSAARQSNKEFNYHRMLSALLCGSIGQAGGRLTVVLRDQGYLSDTPLERDAALAAFRLAHLPTAPVTVTPVTEDMMIALSDQIFALSTRLASIDSDSNSYLYEITANFLLILKQRLENWTSSTSAPASSPDRTSDPRPSTPPHAPMRDAAGRFIARSMEQLELESAGRARRFMSGSFTHLPSPAPLLSPGMTTTDQRFLCSVAGLPPIPCLGDWGPNLIFRTPDIRQKVLLGLQQMDAVFDTVLFDIIDRHSLYAQKSQLVTLKWREIVFIGRATALWALLCLSETPPDDTLRATWLIQAITAAQALKPSCLPEYLDTLHLIVQNFESVRGTFPQAFLHQLLSTLVLHTLERSGQAALVSLVQDWRRQYGSRVDVDMFAHKDKGQSLISIRPAHPKYCDISQLLLDLQTLVLAPAPMFSSVSPKVLTFAAFTSPSAVSRSHRTQRQSQGPPKGYVAPLSLRTDRRIPRFVGRVPRLDGDDLSCWYCAGLLKTARQFFADTADKHAPDSPPRNADHPFPTCKKFKGDMLELARHFLKPPARSVRGLTAVVDFGELPSDHDLTDSEDSEVDPSLN